MGELIGNESVQLVLFLFYRKIHSSFAGIFLYSIQILRRNIEEIFKF